MPEAKRQVRNLVKTMQTIKDLIPKLWPRAPFLKEKLVMIQISAQKRPPELHPRFWHAAAGYLSTFLDPVDCDWKRKIMIEFLGPEASKRKGLYGLDEKDPGHGWEAPSLEDLKDIHMEGEA